MKTVGSVTLAVLLTLALAIDVPGRGRGPQLDVKLVADGLVAPRGSHVRARRQRPPLHRGSDRTGPRPDPGGQVLPTPFLDITDRVVLQSAFDERGLARASRFIPGSPPTASSTFSTAPRREGPNICVGEDGRVPTDPEGCPLQYTRRVSEFRVSATDPNRVDPSTERVVFKIQWPGRKHNGGGLAFGPDGMLYIGLGDGGFVHGPSGADDPFNVDPDLLFGDLSGAGSHLALREDPPHRRRPGRPVPESRRTTRSWATTAFPDEIYAWGFRNPFRISFDRDGDRAMYVSAPADTLFEATYKVTRPGNYGWAIKEGTHCIVRTSAFAPPETITCSSDAQCPIGPQVSTCGAKGVCTCPGSDHSVSRSTPRSSST